MALDAFKNFAKGTVTGFAAGATSASLTTGHGARMPAGAANYVVWNSTDYVNPSDDPNVEILRGTISTDTLGSITRGLEGTSDVNHNTSGKTYSIMATVTAKTLITDLGTTFGPITTLTTPVLGDFSWTNQGGATITQIEQGVYLEAPAAAGENLRLRTKTAPSAPYTITMGYIPNLLLQNYHTGGVVLRESGTGKIMIAGLGWNGALQPRVYAFTNATTYGSFNTPTPASTWFSQGAVHWIRVNRTGSTLTWYWTQDGIHWRTLLSEAMTTHFTTAPDEVGYAVNVGGDTTYEGGITVVSWLQA